VTVHSLSLSEVLHFTKDMWEHCKAWLLLFIALTNHLPAPFPADTLGRAVSCNTE